MVKYYVLRWELRVDNCRVVEAESEEGARDQAQQNKGHKITLDEWNKQETNQISYIAEQ